MAFVSVSGDFCQAQHLVIVDKWTEGLPYEDYTTRLPVLNSALSGSIFFCPELKCMNQFEPIQVLERELSFLLSSANWSSLLSWMG